MKLQIKVYLDDSLIGNFGLDIPAYQPNPYWYRDVQNKIIELADNKFGPNNWNKTKIEEAAE